MYIGLLKFKFSIIPPGLKSKFCLILSIISYYFIERPARNKNNKFKIISESVAEHSYFVAVLTLKLHDDYEFDLEKALKMALVHDIPELHLSDVTHDVKRNFPKLADEVTKAEYVIMRDKYPNWYSEFKTFDITFEIEGF